MSAGGPVRVEPAGIELEVRCDETVFAAAQRSGYWWPTVCGGHGQCTVCVVRLMDGHGHVVPGLTDERDRLLDSGRDFPDARLACQLLIDGPVTVLKRGVRPAQAGRV